MAIMLANYPEERKENSIAGTDWGDESTYCQKQQMDGTVCQQGKYWWAFSIMDIEYFLIQCFGKKKFWLLWVCGDKYNLDFSWNWLVVWSAEKSKYCAFWIYLIKKVYTVSLNSLKCWK